MPTLTRCLILEPIILGFFVFTADAMGSGKDGYSNFVKPFRTLEDLFVNCAVLGYALRVCREFSAPATDSASTAARQQHTLQILQALAALRTCAALPWEHPTSHLLLAAAGDTLSGLKELPAAFPASAASDVAVRWQRDFSVLKTAARARAARLKLAWAAIEGRTAAHAGASKPQAIPSKL